jgi:hypothetical protein
MTSFGLDHFVEICGPMAIMVRVFSTGPVNKITINKMKVQQGASIELGSGGAQLG